MNWEVVGEIHGLLASIETPGHFGLSDRTQGPEACVLHVTHRKDHSNVNTLAVVV